MRITPEYLEQQKLLHKSANYGTSLREYGGDIRALYARFRPRTILNYGCGKMALKRIGTVDVQNYDPAIPEYEAEPQPADMVICSDVLEHIEPECLDEVMDHLRDLTKAFLFATIALRPARKKLPDGRNAHLIVEGAGWWLERLHERFGQVFSNELKDRQELVVIAYKPRRETA